MGIFNNSLNFVKWNIDRQNFSSLGAIYTLIISCLYVAARWVIHGIFGPILKLSRSITLHLYNDSIPGLDARFGIDFSFLLGDVYFFSFLLKIIYF